MKPYQRVALRYARGLEIENPNRTEKIKYTLEIYGSDYEISFYLGSEIIGKIMGTELYNTQLVSIREGEEPPVEGLKCSSDVLSLVDKYPQVVATDRKNRPRTRVLSVSHSALKGEYKGKKIGSDMYLTLARAYWDKTGKPFLYLPDGCASFGSTSEEAKRVWASLGRRMPSSGLCLAILKRP